MASLNDRIYIIGGRKNKEWYLILAFDHLIPGIQMN